jgi:hypothetical protein
MQVLGRCNYIFTPGTLRTTMELNTKASNYTVATTSQNTAKPTSMISSILAHCEATWDE